MNTYSDFSKTFEIVKNFASVLFQEKSEEEIKNRNKRKVRIQVVSKNGKIKFLTTGKSLYKYIKENEYK